MSDRNDLPMTIPAVVRRAAEKFGDIEGIVDGELRLSFAELAEDIDDAARAMIASGVEPGDRVAIWAPNIWEWVVTALGCHSVGGIVIPLNTRFKGNEAGYAIGVAGATRLFTVTDFLDTNYVELLAGAEGAERIEETVVLRGTVPAGCVSWKEFVGRRHDVDRAESLARGEAVQPDDLCDILFTSGTTGRPKGAMLMHSASIRAYNDWSTVVGLRERDRYLIVNPFFHAFGLKSGHPRVLHQRRDDHPPRGLRRARGDAARGRGTREHAPRATGDLPDDPQPPEPRASSTSPRCASRSPARRRSPPR